MFPEGPALHIDVVGIVDQDQRSASTAVYMQGQVINTDIIRADPKKFSPTLIRGGAMDGCEGRARKAERKAGGDGDRRVVMIVDGNARQMLAVSEAFHNALKSFGRAFFQ